MLELNPLSTLSSSGRNYVVHSTDVKNLNDYISDLCGHNYVVHSTNVNYVKLSHIFLLKIIRILSKIVAVNLLNISLKSAIFSFCT